MLGIRLFLCSIVYLWLVPYSVLQASPPVEVELNQVVTKSQTEVEILEFGPWQLVMDVAWSPDGELLVVSAGDWLYIYRTETYQPISKLHIGALTHSITFSPDGSRLAAGSRDGHIRIWKIEKMIKQNEDDSVFPYLDIDAHQKGVTSVTFDHSGRLLASAGYDAIVHVWDTESGETVSDLIGGTYAVPGISFNSDGRLLAILNGEVIRLRELETGRIWGTLRSPTWLYSIAIDPNTGLLAAGDISGNIHLWDPDDAYRTGKETYPEPVTLSTIPDSEDGYQTLLWSVAFHPDESILAAASGDSMIYLWDTASGELLEVWAGHTAGVTSLSFSPDGKILTSGSLDSTLRIWSIDP